MNIVDSSGWLEYFADGTNVDFFVPVIEDKDGLMVPVITLYEVFKRVLQQRNEEEALQAVSIMQEGQVVDLNTEISLNAAKISYDLKLPMADSIILATSNLYHATLWTQDGDFKNIQGVKYIEKKPIS
ncbi:MAG: toxin FitB [Acidobacteriota bacterium]|nr:toxin FitB [Acidobacteriota bacterium]